MADNFDWSVIIELATKGGAKTVDEVDQVEEAVKRLSKANELNSTQEEKANKSTAKRAQELNKSTSETRTNTESLNSQRYALYEVAAAYGAVSAALIGVGVQGTKAFAEMESGFTKVERTSGLYGDAFAPLEADILAVSRALPVATESIQDFAARGAQMGIATDELSGFAEVMAKFVATSPEVDINTVAESFGRLANLTGVNDFEAMASAIAQVGVNSAATDAQIIKTAEGVARAAAAYNFTADEIIGLSAAMASLGVQPEAARGIMVQFISTVDEGAAGLTDAMQVMAAQMNMTEEAATRLWKTDPSEFMKELSKGLTTSGDLTRTLSEMGIVGQRIKPLFAALTNDFKNNADINTVLSKALADSNQGFREKTELDRQYAPIADDLNSKFQLMKNALAELAYTVGQEVAPAFKWMIDMVTGTIQAVSDFSKSPVGGFVTKLVVSLSALVAGYAAIRSALALSTAALMAFSGAAGGSGAAASGLSGAVQLLVARFRELTGAATGAAAATGAVGTSAASSSSGVGALVGGLGKLAKGAGIVGGILAIVQVLSDLRGSALAAIDAVEYFTGNLNLGFQVARQFAGFLYGVAEAFGWVDTAAASSAAAGTSFADVFSKVGNFISAVFQAVRVSAMQFAAPVISAFNKLRYAAVVLAQVFGGVFQNIATGFNAIGAVASSFLGKFNTGFANGIKAWDSTTGGFYNTLRDLAQALPGTSAGVSNLAGAGGGIAPAFDAGSSALDDFGDSAGGAGDAAANLAQEVRTVVDYANDLQTVFSRAFELQFGVGQSQDATSKMLSDMKREAEEAAKRIRELQASIRSLLGEIGVLKSDIATQKYFLSVAVEYGDTKRAAAIQAELAKMQGELANKQDDLQGKTDELSKAQAANSKTLTGNSDAAIKNRESILGLVKSYQDQVVALAKSGLSSEELRVKTEQLRQDFIRQATQLGYNRAELAKYERSFTDISIAIQKLPRNVTIEVKGLSAADAALREFQASAMKAMTNIQQGANNTRNALGSIGGAMPRSVQGTQIVMPPPTPWKSWDTFKSYMLNGGIFKKGSEAWLGPLISGTRQGFSEGGYTGPGGKYEPAGIVHRGEYVIPKQMVNQRTGLPYADALGKLVKGSPSNGGYANGGYVRAAASPNSVDLSAQSIQMLARAVQTQLVLDGKIVGEAASRSYVANNRVGAN